MHATADTETGESIDDPTEDQLTGLIAGLGRSSGSFFTLNPADETRGWYASVSLLPDGSIELACADPDTGEDHQAKTTDTPAGIAGTLTTWLAARS